MTQMITITIKDEGVYDLLKKELNKSGLINILLKEYYKKLNNPINSKKMTLDEVRILKKKEEEILEGKLSSNKIGELEEVEDNLIQAENKLKEQEKKKKEERINAFEGMIPHLFYIEEEKIKDMAVMYEIERLNHESLYDWGIEKGLTPKPPKEEEK